MENNPLLSIIVPVYNVEDYVAFCLDSLLGQKYQNVEVILVDDGSKDRSYEVCKAYADKDSRVKLYRQENQGQSIARNHALRYAQGELITFMDSDDAVEPTTYSSAIALLLSEEGCDHVQFPLRKRVGRPDTFMEMYSGEPIRGTEPMLDNWVVKRDISWIVCNKIFRRELLAGLDFIPGMYFEDNLYACQVLKRSKGICFSAEGAYLYYYREGSTTNTHTTRHYLDMIRVHIMIHQELGQSKDLASARGYMAYMIACDVFANPRWYRKETPIAVEGLKYLKTTSVEDLLSADGLHPRRKMKALGVKLFALLFG